MVEISEDNVLEIISTLQNLVDDIPQKAKIELIAIISELKTELNLEKILKIRDDLDSFSNNCSIDSYTRNEIFNVLSLFETLIWFFIFF